MIVTMLKENYALVLCENQEDLKWLNRSGYESVGEEFYQVIFKDYDEFLEEVKYLITYGAEFDNRNESDAPSRVLDQLKNDNLI